MKKIRVVMMLMLAMLSSMSVSAQNSNEEVVFYESFDGMSGTGGNDGTWDIIAGWPWTWSVTGASNDGWDRVITAVQPASQCVLIGTSGILYTPTLTKLDGDATLTFKAGSSTKSSLADLYLAIENGGSLDVQTIKLEAGKFNEYTIKIKEGTPDSKIKFYTNVKMALFLDEVRIVKDNTTTAIANIKKENKAQVTDTKVYNLNGQFIGTSTQGLKQGVYIINNKKVVVK